MVVLGIFLGTSVCYGLYNIVLLRGVLGLFLLLVVGLLVWAGSLILW